MKKILQKISWKTRRLNLSVILLEVLLHNHHHEWGFDFFRVEYKLRSYSFLKVTFRLPNGAEVRKTSYECDFLFLRTPLLRYYSELSDRRMWSFRKTTVSEDVWYKLLGILFGY